MSEDTASMLEEALAAAARLREQARQQRVDCLAHFAAELPNKVDALAKRTAHAEPEVTKQLGTQRVQQLRGELRQKADFLAANIQGATDEVKWPTGQTNVRVHDIHSALFNYMYGERINELVAVFKQFGYSICDDNVQRAQGLIIPQQLYDESGFGPVAGALGALGEAERRVARAKAADDNSTVDDMWENGAD